MPGESGRSERTTVRITSGGGEFGDGGDSGTGPAGDVDPFVGATFLHYSVVERLGGGGMGDVYLAEDMDLGRPVALKFLARRYAADPAVRARFQREAQAAARLHHPNIVHVYEIGSLDGRPYIVMEYVDGHSLKELALGTEVPLAQIMDWARQLARGLARAHRAGVVHRDIKPGNVLIDQEGAVKIADFGLAKVGKSEDLTRPGERMGTAGYMSPEQAQGRPVDHRSDIFCFGALLHEMLTGEPAFERESFAAAVYAVVHEEPPSLATLRPGVPAALARILARTLQKRPEQRYESMDELLADLVRVSLGERAGGESECPERSVVVLPLRDLSPERDQGYVGEGIAEEIVGALARFGGLRVISAHSRAARERGADAREAGRCFGVQTVLSGSLRRAGERLRVHLTLTDAGEGATLWSRSFEPAPADLFTMQDEIAAAVAAALQPESETGGAEPLRRHSADPEAHRSYLRGRYFWYERYDGGLQKAFQHFRRAIDLDPGYALAHAGLADTYSISAFFFLRPPLEAFPEARSLAERARSLAPDLPEAHASLGAIRFWFDWDWAAAEQSFQQAVLLDPRSVDVRQWYAELLAALGRHAEARRQIDAALAVEPLQPILWTASAWLRYFAGDLATAERDLEQARDLQADFAPAAIVAGEVALARQDPEGAARIYRGRLEGSPDDDLMLALLGHALGRSGQRREAGAVLTDLEERGRRGYQSPLMAALVHVGLGDLDQAFIWLDRAYAERNCLLVYLDVLHVFDPIRADRRFGDLARRIGLPLRRATPDAD